jgi:hypothetical protein
VYREPNRSSSFFGAVEISNLRIFFRWKKRKRDRRHDIVFVIVIVSEVRRLRSQSLVTIYCIRWLIIITVSITVAYTMQDMHG